jgi:hypothetical protein
MDANINFRVPQQLLEDFERACQQNYTTKSEVLRQAMVEYVRKNKEEIKMSKIRIIPVKEEGDLYYHYSGQINQQKCFLELDFNEDEPTLSANYDPEIGNAIPRYVWHNRARRFPIACIKASAANGLMKEALPLAERIYAGYECNWDGSNWVGSYTDDAEQASEELQRLCDDYSGVEEYMVNVWDAHDWLAGSDASELGITAQTTDKELKDIAERLEHEAKSDGVHVIRGLEDYLERVRDELQDAEDED